MAFPLTRPRRLRRTEALRRMVRETQLSPDDFIYPLFVTHGKDVREPIASLPGSARLSADRVGAEAKELKSLGVPAVILFGIPPHKDATGTGAYDHEGVVPRAAMELKNSWPELVVIADICLCEYTDHGHCGVLDGGHEVDNDKTLPLLARSAVACARAGCDVVAPSDMMDGRVGAIRRALDEESLQHVPLMSYAAKYASAFYGPFRDAAGSTPAFGDRRGYQMDPANAREALREVALDLEEGADIVMVKPAATYLDVIRAVRERFDAPVAAYHVSGEYAMLKAAAERGWLDEKRATLETLTAIRRAGADLILTYAAKDAARWLAQ
jgi:porphobilinogen synthase